MHKQSLAQDEGFWADLSFTPGVVAYFLGQVRVVGDQEVIEDGARLDLNQIEVHITLASRKHIQ